MEVELKVAGVRVQNASAAVATLRTERAADHTAVRLEKHLAWCGVVPPNWPATSQLKRPLIIATVRVSVSARAPAPAHSIPQACSCSSPNVTGKMS